MKIKEHIQIVLCDSLLVASTGEMEGITVRVKGTKQRYATRH